MPVSEPPQAPPSPATIDEVFKMMSDESRRRVLYYLRHHGGTADVDDLREHLSKRPTDEPVEISVDLHHRILPALDDSDLVAYDPQSDRVRYEGGQLATELLEWLEHKERNDR